MTHGTRAGTLGWPRVLVGWLFVARLLLAGPAAAASLDEWRSQLAEGRLLSDMVAVIGSLDFVMGEVDR